MAGFNRVRMSFGFFVPTAFLQGGGQAPRTLPWGVSTPWELRGEGTALGTRGLAAQAMGGRVVRSFWREGGSSAGIGPRRRQRAQEQQRLGDDALLAGAVGASPCDVERAELAIRNAGVAEPR